MNNQHVSIQTSEIVRTSGDSSKPFKICSYICLVIGSFVCLAFIAMAYWGFTSPNCHGAGGPMGSCGMGSIAILIVFLPLAVIVTIAIFIVLRAVACAVGSGEQVVVVSHPVEMSHMETVHIDDAQTFSFPSKQANIV